CRSCPSRRRIYPAKRADFVSNKSKADADSKAKYRLPFSKLCIVSAYDGEKKHSLWDVRPSTSRKAFDGNAYLSFTRSISKAYILVCKSTLSNFVLCIYI